MVSQMLCFKNQSDTLIVVLHEIYGINDHIAGVCKTLSDMGYDAVCPDFLEGKPSYDYSREDEAYRYFMNYAGFVASAKRVVFLLRQEESEYRNIYLLGYSIGATIAWICSGAGAGNQNVLSYGGCIKNLKGMVGYYGSRIRDYLDMDPNCPALLFFPEEENSFDTQELAEKLRKKENTEVNILKGKHGFADPHSQNYNKSSAWEADRIRNDFFTRTRLR